MNYLDFNSRETYLVLRKQWSEDYLTAVKRIRKAKIAIKEGMRAGTLGWAEYSELRKAHEAIQELPPALYSMKQEAQRQYLAQKSR